MVTLIINGIITKMSIEQFKIEYFDIINILINNGVVLDEYHAHTSLNYMALYDEIDRKIGLFIPEASYHCFLNHKFSNILKGDATMIMNNGAIYIYELKHNIEFLDTGGNILDAKRNIIDIESTKLFKKIVEDSYCNPEFKRYADELIWYFNDLEVMEKYKIKLSTYAINTKITFKCNPCFDITKFDVDCFVKNKENIRHFRENLFLQYPKNIMPSHHGISSLISKILTLKK